MITIFDIFEKITKKKSSSAKASEDKKEVKDAKESEKKEAEKNDYSKEIQENVSIHVMPERFRVVHHQKAKAKTAGILIIIGGVLVLAIASFLLYYYLLKPSNPEAIPENIPEDIISDTLESEPLDTPALEEDILEQVVVKDPKDSYIEIKAAFDDATVFDEYDIAVQKYGSRSKVASFEIEKRKVDNMPASFKNNTISLVIQQGMPKLDEIGDITLVEQENLATINATTIDLKKEGIIQLVFEDDEWKIDSEIWENVGDKDIEDPEIFSKGIDSDSDGLTDKEEQIFNSDISISDSDGDGYSDISEIINLYNPAGTGKLEENEGFKKYINDTYSYSFLYPENWALSNIGGGETIMFRSSDNHFIQIVAQTNAGKQSIEDWYEAQFNVSTINNSQKVSKNIWQGIKSNEGLIIYLTDSGLNNIYIITYNLGNNNVIEYQNIYDLVINSFEVESFN